MLPLRISVQGFMSYRDLTVFDFEGARLWMLAGENGAGKSSVFDALRWALFGVHRAGRQNSEQLIHHESSKLLVEVELQMGSEVFKLKRTLGRDTSRPTWDIARRAGEAWESVAGTGMANGYNEWIARNIGLTDEAFCASVYLSQNRADAILNANADERYELLSQLVDLSQLERWHERAVDRRTSARIERDEARKRWESAPLPEPESLEQLRVRGDELEQTVEVLDKETRELDAARARSSLWEEWNGKVQTLESDAQKWRALIGEEAHIERDFARLQHLKQHHGAVDAFVEVLARCEELQLQQDELKPLQVLAERELSDARAHEEAALAALDKARENEKAARLAWNALFAEVTGLAPEREELKRRAQLMAQREKQQAQNATFEDDLDARLVGAQNELEQARAAERSLPSWQRFDAARRAIARAQEQHEAWKARETEAIDRQDALQSGLSTAREALQGADYELSECRELVTQINERERALKERCADFARVESDLTCHFCGQELSPAHRAAEAQRLEVAARELSDEQNAAKDAFDEAEARFQKARKNEESLHADCEKARDNIKQAALEMARQGDNIARERIAARAAWDELSTVARAEVGLEGDEFERGLSEKARPDARDFEQLSARTRKIKTLEQSVVMWQKREHQRATIHVELQRIEEELAPILKKWSDEEVEAWHARAASVEEQSQNAKTDFDVAGTTLENASETARKASQNERTSRAKHDELSRTIGPLAGQLAEARNAVLFATPAFDRALEREGEALPSLEETRRAREEWARETKHLENTNIAAKHEELSSAREKLVSLERERHIFQEQIESLAVVARQPYALVEALWNDAKTHLTQAQEEAARVGDEVRILEHQARARVELEALLHEKSLEFARWDKLAELLGPRELQRHLLREAEAGIVREANRVLETISGGTLRLELVPDSDEPTGNRRPKVLDVVCFHRSAGEPSPPISPAFLSGSQRFRVAVALALGIGRCASRGTQGNRSARVETILIDEGFGGLDKTGRDEMKDELRDLGRELGRVILVSHQEDFAGAFPNRFEISLEAGVSRVRKVVG